MNILTLKVCSNFNSITRKIDKSIKGLQEDIERLDAEHERQVGTINKAQDAIVDIEIFKVAANTLRDQLKKIN
jgi:hypothetical protein